MLSNQLMGTVALGILWINTLLIAAATWNEAWALLRRRASLTPFAASGEGPGLGRATVLRGSAEGPLAVHRVEQRGRTGAPRRGHPVIHFADRSMQGEILGGALTIEGIEGEVVVQPSREAEVWTSAEEMQRAADCPSDEVFDLAHAQATKARGFLRTVEVPLLPGQEVFVYGALSRWGVGHAVGPMGRSLLVSTLDPRPLLLRLAARLIAFAVVSLTLCAGATALALHQPRFEGLSKAGAFLCGLFFILVQPLSIALRDASRVPSRAFLRGHWTRRAALSPDAPLGDGSQHADAAAR